MASFYLKRRNEGICKMLKGNILINFIMLNDNYNRIDHFKKISFEKVVNQAIDDLVAEAKKYKQKLKIDYRILDQQINGNLYKYESVAHLFKFDSKLKPIHFMDEQCKKTYDGIATFYVYPFHVRGGAVCAKSDCKCDEYARVSYDAKATTIIHELLHLFGAIDLYYPTIVKQQANHYLGNGYMNSGSCVDAFNAYMIGWCDQMNKEAQAFYKSIETLTYDEYKKALDEQWGIVNNKKRNGYSEYQYTNGAKYKGEWHNNLKEGKGTMTYSSNAMCYGDFKHDQLNGYGMMIYDDGSKYVGYWKDNKCHGEGTYIYKNGNIYHGSFVNNQIEGYGVLMKTNHEVIRGYWKNGNYQGEVGR